VGIVLVIPMMVNQFRRAKLTSSMPTTIA